MAGVAQYRLTVFTGDRHLWTRRSRAQAAGGDSILLIVANGIVFDRDCGSAAVTLYVDRQTILATQVGAGQNLISDRVVRDRSCRVLEIDSLYVSSTP